MPGANGPYDGPGIEVRRPAQVRSQPGRAHRSDRQLGTTGGGPLGEPDIAVQLPDQPGAADASGAETEQAGAQSLAPRRAEAELLRPRRRARMLKGDALVSCRRRRPPPSSPRVGVLPEPQGWGGGRVGSGGGVDGYGPGRRTGDDLEGDGPKMEPILTRCGYRCDLCLAYRPNIETNPENRQILSDGWHKCFGFPIPPEETPLRRLPDRPTDSDRSRVPGSAVRHRETTLKLLPMRGLRV